MVLPITSDQHEYAKSVQEKLAAAGLRAQLDDRNEKVGYKIREAETQKIPFMLVVGQKEVDAGLVSVRKQKMGDLGQKTVDDFISEMQKSVLEKSIN